MKKTIILLILIIICISFASASFNSRTFNHETFNDLNENNVDASITFSRRNSVQQNLDKIIGIEPTYENEQRTQTKPEPNKKVEETSQNNNPNNKNNNLITDTKNNNNNQITNTNNLNSKKENTITNYTNNNHVEQIKSKNNEDKTRAISPTDNYKYARGKFPRQIELNVVNHYTNEILNENEYRVVRTDGTMIETANGISTFYTTKPNLSIEISAEGYYNSIRFIELKNPVRVEDRAFHNITLRIIPNQTNETLGYDPIEKGFDRVFRNQRGQIQGTNRWEVPPTICIDNIGINDNEVAPTQEQLQIVNQTLEYYPEFTNNFSDPLNTGKIIINGTKCEEMGYNPEINGVIYIGWLTDLPNPGEHGEQLGQNGLTIINAYAIFIDDLLNENVYAQEILQVLGARDDIDNWFDYEWPPGESVFCSVVCRLTLPTPLDLTWGQRAYDRKVGNLYPDTDVLAFQEQRTRSSSTDFTEVRNFYRIVDENGKEQKYTVFKGYYYANQHINNMSKIYKALPENANLITYSLGDYKEIKDPLEIKQIKQIFYPEKETIKENQEDLPALI